MVKSRAFIYALSGGAVGLILSMLVFFVVGDTGAAAIVVIFLSIPLIFAVLGTFFGSKLDRAILENDELHNGIREAEEHLGKIAQAAVAGADWNVDIEDNVIPTCWEVKDCTAAECPVFRKKNIRCWFIAGTYCGGEPQGTFAQKLSDCSNCEVYQAAITAHPVGKIRESFNNMLWVVNEKAHLLAATNTELQAKLEELEKLQVETQKMADTDSLTGLNNYGHFNEYLKRKVASAKRYGKVISLMMLDFNNFKKVNEVYGYQKGDLILQTLAGYLKDMADDNNYVARFGNEEFVMVLPDSDGEVAIELARKIVSHTDGIAATAEVDAGELRLSAGVADLPDCANDERSLVAAADAALFFAKKSEEGIAYFCDLSEQEFSQSDIERLRSRLHGAGVTTLTALARAVDTTDLYSETDRMELSSLANGMAAHLGMDEDEGELLVLAASIHDIGKIGVPTDVLNKTDKLSPLEVDMVKRHPEIGQEILREARQIQELVLAILYHHERWDGNGYPEGLTGKKIPFMARIVGIFDAYRAMRCDRPYRKALSQQQAVEELRKGSGSQFDPELVEVFIQQLQTSSGQGLRETG